MRMSRATAGRPDEPAKWPPSEKTAKRSIGGDTPGTSRKNSSLALVARRCIPLHVFKRGHVGQAEGIVFKIIERVDFQAAKKATSLKKHHSHELSIDTSKSVGKRAVHGRIGNSEFRWHRQVHGRTATRTFTSYACVIKLREIGNTLLRSKLPKKAFSKCSLGFGQRSIFVHSNGGFVPTKAIKKSQADPDIYSALSAVNMQRIGVHARIVAYSSVTTW
jgi:hypothetical protein